MQLPARTRTRSPWCCYYAIFVVSLFSPLLLATPCHASGGILDRFITTYDPEQVAIDATQSDSLVKVQDEGTFISFIPQTTPFIPVGFVFYTGAFVDPISYAPLARALAEAGYPSFLLTKLPLNFAFLAPLAASRVIHKYDDDDVEAWVVGGHSLGGVVASLYANYYSNEKSDKEVAGLVLLASYPTPVLCDLSKTDLTVTSLWGDLDGITSRLQWEGSENQLPEDAAFVEIDGGNHAQMGYYGDQEGDNPATITREEQQDIVVAETLLVLQTVALDYGLIEEAVNNPVRQRERSLGAPAWAY